MKFKPLFLSMLNEKTVIACPKKYEITVKINTQK